ncbi:VOC family protein [Mangrovivirga sp. M17]|uniref:VOC family protein n=1 Tax=Mangrovivirga halotolerans TaxID=2993936 RepID=A0ABT3RTF0_9BACT|nr:VOC family protein [Mangrovivirga halotolerans]MCX2744916.1 VOC family protein [Mangrovivirga halotolerans]
MNIDNYSTQIFETCLYSRNLEAAKTFYVDRLGFSLYTYVPDTLLFLKMKSGMLLIFNPDKSKDKEGLPPHFAEGKQHIAFNIDEEKYEKVKMELQKEGIDIIHEEKWPSGSKSFYFEDPEGHVLEFVPAKVWD